jgi:hypothetical protein
MLWHIVTVDFYYIAVVFSPPSFSMVTLHLAPLGDLKIKPLAAFVISMSALVEADKKLGVQLTHFVPLYWSS